ncbi:MAG: peptide chain release factor N(5)-glutamine methyltransferase, partial [Methylotenera sp.]
LEAQLLLQHVLNVNRAWLIIHDSDALQANEYSDFKALLNRRLRGEPIAHILGYREFYGLNLKVTPDTLIPRPDTETLVETALAKISPHQAAHILDLGTGTGAVALAIASKRSQTLVTAVDASQAALNVAIENAKNLNITNVHFVLSDWFTALDQQKFDVIVSNPPYIEQEDAHLNQGDLRFEPISALASGQDGLDDIRKIIDDCLLHLKPQGWLMLEHGYNQAEQVADLMAQTGLVDIETIKDFGGNHRVTISKNPLIVSTHWG